MQQQHNQQRTLYTNRTALHPLPEGRGFGRRISKQQEVLGAIQEPSPEGRGMSEA
ncbi:hypothetical protein Nhal_0459 [Nitrosococcus halophilus Nc 4]|uniref:Uncharacterized protein n=1 Tax=Nitrosococcus halophilus (strain Nc4) TaxID=472759 RepID=D5BVL7_NITHN|nr:hypothetical protein Nhal_0459 [Nitrosococcus halophilus Nc 4]